MIQVQGVGFRLDNGTQILDDVNLSLQTGQVVALIGPNGAGKSTLFNLMARILPLQSGKVSFGGYDVATTDGRKLACTLAMLTQENHVQGRLRVRELLMFGRYPHHQGTPTPEDVQRVEAVLAEFELTALSERFLSDLSGGQRQRVLIAMVVCQDTPYLLLDEPLNNLDMYHAGRLMRKLRVLAKAGKTIVIVLHDINQAAQFADTVVMMKSGQIIAIGKPIDVLTASTMKQLYQVDVTVLYHDDKPVIVDAV
ncbi:ATP-binding cassette domain-containing protein [Moraxella sp. FZFQ2102]|uniref:ATP-binding cassette domain-containing protein n=1 Tax=Moraxella sp. FZFQ2102 TaxID=2953752 RepID=UPI00209C6482|nr:ATP-binding cassette domain-containing protein [Moraxella sp. FZFQ2102]USZ13999.1 ATP-binding cassette domain-containing protein [Moraxella sp. FZFQ2102]